MAFLLDTLLEARERGALRSPPAERREGSERLRTVPRGPRPRKSRCRRKRPYPTAAI